MTGTFYYVYILVSEADQSVHYTGVTRDLSTRLKEHNQGACTHTARHRPWRIETSVAFRSQAKARVFERYLKKAQVVNLPDATSESLIWAPKRQPKSTSVCRLRWRRDRIQYITKPRTAPQISINTSQGEPVRAATNVW